MSEARLLQWEQWVDDWFDTSVDESLEDFKGVVMKHVHKGNVMSVQN